VLPILLAASEPSKVAWYIGGGVLAVYAVVLATIGLKRPDFPYSAAGARGVMAVTFVLVAVAIGAAIATG
jgi:hypothetical protein